MTTDPTVRSDEVERLTDEQIASYADEAATAWCGRKERETFPEDRIYFLHNWRALPGLRAFAEAVARQHLIERTER